METTRAARRKFASKFQRLTQRKPPTPPENHPSAHAGSRARVTSMGGLYDAATLHARLCHDQLTTNRPLTPPHPLPGRRATSGDHCNASKSSSSKFKPVGQIPFEQIQANSTSGRNLKQLQRKKANGDNPSSSSEVHFKIPKADTEKATHPTQSPSFCACRESNTGHKHGRLV